MTELKVTFSEMRGVWSKALAVGGAIANIKSGGRDENLYILKFETAKECEGFAIALANLGEAVTNNAKTIMERANET